MKVIAYCGEEEFELNTQLNQIGKKITIFDDKRRRTFTIIDTETILEEALYKLHDGERKICNITETRIYLEEDEIH